MTGGAPTISIEHHPRVAARVRSAKAWGALVAFAVVALASASAGAEPFDVLSRALAAGAVGWIVSWFAAVAVGRAVVRAELDAQTAARAAAAAATADEQA